MNSDDQNNNNIPSSTAAGSTDPSLTQNQTPIPTWPLPQNNTNTTAPTSDPQPPFQAAPPPAEVSLSNSMSPTQSSSPTQTANSTTPSWPSLSTDNPASSTHEDSFSPQVENSSLFPSSPKPQILSQDPSPSSVNSVFPNTVNPFTQPEQPPTASPPAPSDPAPVSSLKTNYEDPLTLNPNNPNNDPMTPTDHSIFMSQDPASKSGTSTDTTLNLDTPSQPQTPIPTSPITNPSPAPPNLASLNSPDTGPTDLSQLTANGDPFSSPLYTPPLTANDNLGVPPPPTGLPEALPPTTSHSGVSKKLLIVGAVVIVLVTVTSAVFILELGKTASQTTLSLPAQEPLTNPPKTIKKEQPKTAVTSTATPSATDQTQVATQSALDKLKGLKQATSSTQSSQ